MTAAETSPVASVLDVPERVAEILFGLIMALAFMGTMQVSAAGRDEGAPAWIAAVGCNLAWGLVDGVMYVVQALVERGRRKATLRALAAARDEGSLRQILGNVLPPRILERLRVEDLEGLRALAAEHGATLHARFTFADVRAAALVCGLVVLATFPVVIPYLVFDDPHVARLASNAVSIVLLYVCGHILGRHCGARPFRTGLLMVAIGAVLVLTILALGG